MQEGGIRLASDPMRVFVETAPAAEIHSEVHKA